MIDNSRSGGSGGGKETISLASERRIAARPDQWQRLPLYCNGWNGQDITARCPAAAVALIIVEPLGCQFAVHSKFEHVCGIANGE